MIRINNKEVDTVSSKYSDEKEPSKISVFVRKCFIVLGIASVILGFSGMFLEYTGDSMRFFYSYHGSLLLLIIFGIVTILVALNPETVKLHFLLIISLIGHGVNHICLGAIRFGVETFRRASMSVHYLRWATKNKVKIKESKLLYLKYLEEQPNTVKVELTTEED